MPDGLSDAALSAWGKSNREDGAWLPLWSHIDDTGGVASWLWEHWLPRSVRALIAHGMTGGDEDGRLVLSWLAGIHDVGKVSPAFAVQWPEGARHMAEHGLVVAEMGQVLATRRSYRHELASLRALSDWLVACRGWTGPATDSYAVVVGSHHGRPPQNVQLRDSKSHPELLGEDLWHRVRVELLARAATCWGVSDHLERWGGFPLSIQSQVLLTACIIVADWIASDDRRFDYGECIHDPNRVTAAMRVLELPRPWRARAGDPLAKFADRFDLAPGVAPRPMQCDAVDLVRALDEPGLVILEAPMGEGKTEAALMMAEVLAERSGAGGLYVALPSRATASAMFARALCWLDKIAAEHPGTVASVTLAHAKAALDERYQGLRRIGREDPGDTDTERGSTIAVHQWLGGRKKALLANFAVGTIDQVLFGALKAKHLMLRHLALAGKVVILDEVHAYDTYMSVYLERVLEWLGAYRVPVIALSATLPGQRRAALLAAYDTGRRASARRRDRDAKVDYSAVTAEIGYPLLTASSPSGPLVRTAKPSGRGATVMLERLVEDEDNSCLAARLWEELADGGCAAVIRNTVGRVQHTARSLRRLMPDTEVIVAHSRFLAAHRARKDDDLIALFGKDGRAERTSRRYVVVSSQVIEQSLDLDFDIMVTDIAPVDLLLQRVGRLHRHVRSRSPRLTTPRCLVTAVTDWEAVLPEIDKGTRAVYSSYVLHRTIAAIADHLDGLPLEIPAVIPGLVNQVYGAQDPGIPTDWVNPLNVELAGHEAGQRDKRARAQAFLPGDPYGEDIVGWLKGDAGEADEESPAGRRQVRDSDESVDVLVVRRIGDGTLRTMPGIGAHADKPIPEDGEISYGLARAIASSSVTLPRALSHPGIIDATIALLERNDFANWQAQWLLHGELVLVLDETNNAAMPDAYEVHYGGDGLEHAKGDPPAGNDPDC